MTTPVDEKANVLAKTPSSEEHEESVNRQNSYGRSDEDGTVVGEPNDSFGQEPQRRTNTNQTGPSYLGTHDGMDDDQLSRIQSRSRTRERANRLGDDLALLKVERQVSEAAEAKAAEGADLNLGRTRSRRDDTVDEFDIATNPVHEKTQVYSPPAEPATNLAKFVKRLHHSSWLVRYITYITPIILILLIPLMLGIFVFPNATVGKVELTWFIIWLMICWLTLWAGRLLAKALPWPIGVVSSLFTNNGKKWRDMGKQLELPATLFFWWLAIEISFLPTMKNRQRPRSSEIQPWMSTTNKVIVSIFVGAVLNFVEKIIIQLIAISFHLRTYQDRIELNKFQIGSLAKLYEYSKTKIAMEDSEFEERSGPGSGARTPGAWVNEASKQTKDAVTKFGDVAGKIAGDFTGKSVAKSSHPHQVVLSLLNSTPGSQVLARRLYRTFAREETQTVYQDDLTNAFSNEEEATAAFSMFDKDMNGDISMEELEAVCVEIGRERKSITASLKDLDSVVSKLDDVFMFVVAVIVILVFISIISTSAATAITSAGSALLALSWLFSATAQEFLQSVIFVFIKHPFDVGDRVSVYGNTGALGRGDDYFVKEISLLYTEFKKMEGHIVQAPNSYLNTLFILNQRRSGGLAEAVPVTFKYGTSLEQIETLRARLLEFVTAEKREYQSNILTELREVNEAHAITLNIVFFYKSNWQNEGLRLARRNKFICALMVTMQELGIEGPRMRYPGMKESFPVYMQHIPHMATPNMGRGGHPDNPGGFIPAEPTVTAPTPSAETPFVPPLNTQTSFDRGQAPLSPSGGVASADFLRHTSFRAPTRRQRAESLTAMNRRVDFSLGARDALLSSDLNGDVYDDRSRSRIPPEIREVSESRERERQSEEAVRASLESSRLQQLNTREREMRDRAISASGRAAPGPGYLARRSTDSARTNHRNRFFGRHRSGTEAREGEMYALESGLADVPEGEGSGNTSATRAVMAGGAGHAASAQHALGSGTVDVDRDAGVGQPGHGHVLRPHALTVTGPSPVRLDPRSGRESPAAWHERDEEGRLLRPQGSAESFEMGRMR